jgi:hypothetical protein
MVLAELEERCIGSGLERRPSSFEEFCLSPINPPPPCRLIRSFNWYHNKFGHSLALTGFVTRRQHGERCCQACGPQWRGFQLLEKPNSQLPLEPGSCHLGDRVGGVRDPNDARQCDPR